MVEVHPATNAIDVDLPCRVEGRHDFPALVVERLDADSLLDLAFVFDSQILFRLGFHRESVAIPAPGARHIETAHRLVSRYDVLQDADEDRPVMRTARGERRA